MKKPEVPKSITIIIYNYAAFEATGEGLKRAITIDLTGEQKAEIGRLMHGGEGIAACYPSFEILPAP